MNKNNKENNQKWKQKNTKNRDYPNKKQNSFRILKKNAGQAELNRWAFTPLRIWSPHLTPAKISPAQS